jgi:hypothetical protein
MLITIAHPEGGPQKTFSTAEVAADATTTSVENNDGFSSNDLVLFGKFGEEKTEVVTLTSTTGNSTIGHTTGPVFAHPARTPLWQLPYDQAEISRATAEGGTYSVLTTVSLSVDEEDTIYNDTAGVTTSWYKIRYKNSVTGSFSDYSDEVQGTGYTAQSLRDMTDEILEDFGDPDTKEVSRDRVRNYINAGVRKITHELIKTYPDFRKAYTTQSLTADTATYALPTNFLAFVRVDVNFDGSTATDAYKAIFESEREGQPNTTYHESAPRIYIRGTNFGIRPTPSTTGSTAFIWYWDYPSTMTNETDEHGLPYGAREPLVSYALYRLWLTKDEDTSARYRSLFRDAMDEFIEFVGQSRQMMWKQKTEIMFGADLYDTWL